MPIVLDGSLGVTTPMYNGTITANAVTPSVNMKNRIINGAMVIDQRNAGASVATTSAFASIYTLDRWFYAVTAASKFTIQQNAGSVTPPVGFTNYLGCTSTSAYSVSSSDALSIRQTIEGFNIADLAWGTANAKTVTLSFWVRSSLTGTFGGSIYNSAVNRCYPFSYTIPAANTWTQISVTIAGDTTGTWLTNNGAGLTVNYSLGTGSTGSGTAGAWGSTFFNSTTGATSVVGTNGATFYITGVQLEVGSTATSFDYRPYGTELALCQRYAYSLFSPGGGNYFLATGGSFGSGTNGFISLNFPQVMRATPSLSPTPTAGNYQVYLPNGGTYQTLTSISLNGVSTNNFALLNFGIASGGTAGQVCYLNSPSSASPIIFSAEL